MSIDYKDYVSLGNMLMTLVVNSSLQKARQIRDSGVSRMYFEGRARDAWDRYWDIADTTGRCPEDIDLELDVGFRPSAVSPLDDAFEIAGRIAGYLAVEVFDVAFQKARDLCMKGDLNGAIDLASTALSRAKVANHGLVRATQFFEKNQAVVDLYKRMKSGEMGIPFPWRNINEMTMGMWPGNMVLFTARTGIGKTYITLVIAEFIERKCDDVMITYISPEMLETEIVERFLAMREHLPVGKLIRGDLSGVEEDRLFSCVERYRPSDNFVIADRTKFIRARDQLAAIDSLIDEQNEKAIRRGKRHLVIVDALYKLGRIPDPTEKMIQNVLWSVESCIKFNVPFLVTSQLGRSAGTGGMKASLETIGLTDVAGQEAHQAFALFRDDEMKTRKEMGLAALKVRRLARDGKTEFTLNWDFDKMLFSETTDPGDRFVDADYGRNATY